MSAPSVCAHGLCTRKNAKGSIHCKAHKRLAPRSYPEGTRVVFAPGPVSAALYSIRPAYGARGVVVSVPLPGKRATFLPGPAGGLLYVRWEGYVSNGSQVCGVSPLDCYRDNGCERCGVRRARLPYEPVGCPHCNPGFWKGAR